MIFLCATANKIIFIFLNFNSKNKAQNIDNFNQNLQKIAQHKVKYNASKNANI